jgi:predicted DNA-binding transcriptional regulator AlpA
MTTTNILNLLPDEAMLRLPYIIGQTEITEEQAKLSAEHPATTCNGKPKFKHKRPRPGIPALLPISKTSFYDGIKKGLYPKPYHLGKTAVWKVSEIREALAKIAA